MKKIKSFIQEIGTVNKYMLLDRLVSDCKYYIGNGNRSSRLWAGSESEQIWSMKIIWLSLPINKKPEWLSMNDILSIEKQMIKK